MAHNRFSNRPFWNILSLTCCFLLSATAVQSQEIGSQQPPPPPTNLLALYRDKTILLSWDPAKLPSIAEYDLFRVDNSDPNRAVYIVAKIPKAAKPGKMYYKDNTAVAGHTYTYFMTSKDAYGIHSTNSKMSAVQKPYQ